MTGGAAGAGASPDRGGSATARPAPEEPLPGCELTRACPENAEAAAPDSTTASPNEPATIHRVARDTERVPRSREAANRAGLWGPRTGARGLGMRIASASEV